METELAHNIKMTLDDVIEEFNRNNGQQNGTDMDVDESQPPSINRRAQKTRSNKSSR